MPLKIGATDINAVKVGTTDIQKVYQGTDLIVDYSASGVSPEAQAVLDRMVNLSPTEENAIIAFVDAINARGDWNSMEEIYCFALNETDSLTGFKSKTATLATPANWTHTSNGWVTASASTNNHIGTSIIPSDIWNTGNRNGAIGAWVKSLDYIGSGNYDMMGSVDSGFEIYLRHRGNDTEDVNSVFCGTGLNSKPSVSQTDFQDDLFSSGRRLDTEQFMKKGANELIVETIAWENVPSIEVYLNGRNNAGAAQNGRASGYSFSFVLNGSFVGGEPGYDLFYADVKTLLTTLGVADVP